jgi:hypothetical protein
VAGGDPGVAAVCGVGQGAGGVSTCVLWRGVDPMASGPWVHPLQWEPGRGTCRLTAQL